MANRDKIQLSAIGREQHERILQELNKATKMLVRRDMELTRINDELVEADRAKSRFISIAAHQLRTPLSVTKWTFRMLLSEDFGSLNDQQRAVLERGYNTNEAMVGLISDLLDVARIESGKFAYKLESISLKEIVKRVVAAMRPKAQACKVEMSIKGGEEEEVFIQGDKNRLETVLENLVTNAMNYTLPGGQIDVIYKKGEGFLEVQVKDTGVGIPQKNLGRIFTKFFRGENVVKMQTSGSGLGLFVAKSMIEAHGGTIGVESAEGKGSTFWFRLPIKS